MLCPKCLCEIPDETQVCPLCGAELTATENTAESDAAVEAAVATENAATEEAVVLEEPAPAARKSKSDKVGLIFGIVGLALSAVPVLIELIAFVIPVVGLFIAFMLGWLIGPCRLLGAVAAVVGLIIGLKNRKQGIGKLGLALSIAGLAVAGGYTVYLFIAKLISSIISFIFTGIPILFFVLLYIIYFALGFLMLIFSGL